MYPSPCIDVALSVSIWYAISNISRQPAAQQGVNTRDMKEE